ncbi:hypothetical protein SLS53_001528 [Cytospora paraplurivora]|uniref:Uncharacterized protein n=1 Tax=Cytospora paraplurivora TaxID=2898453 RepID=A0AAN9YLY1_9PEZI
MDCLVMVIRHVYFHLEQNDALDKIIETNEVLAFAFLNFGVDTTAGLENVQGACERMFGVIMRDWRLGENPGFADLIESEPMLRSIWSYESFLLFHPILHKGLEAYGWELITDERKQTLFEARESLVVWDTEKHKRLEDAVAFKSGRFTGRRWKFFRGTVERTKCSRMSVAMWVKFLPRKRLEDFNINAIREIKAPAHVPQYKTKLGTEGAPEIKTVEYRNDDKGPASYLLVAAVRLRSSESGCDSVRLYDILAENIVPIVPIVRDSSYMLYYIHNDGNAWDQVQDEIGRKGDGDLNSQVVWPNLPDAEASDDREPVEEEAPADEDGG